VDNNLQNIRGTLAMARTNDPNSATSGFFINHVDNAFLNSTASNNGYAVFGQVTAGIEVVDTIAVLPTSNNDLPVSLVIIESVQRRTPNIVTRNVDKTVEGVQSYFINQYQIGLGPSMQFYWMAQQQAIIEIDLDNSDSNFAPVVTLHLFAVDDSDVRIGNWLANQGSDVIEPNAAVAQISYTLPPSAVQVSDAITTGQQTFRKYDADTDTDIDTLYDNYTVSYSVDGQSIAGRFSLEAFSDSLDVAVEASVDQSAD
jgi:hypothetical protein